jgi:hypothetical protein
MKMTYSLQLLPLQRWLFAGILFFCFGQTNAQEAMENTPKARFSESFKVEIGLNTIPLLKAIANKGQDSLGLSPYLLNTRFSWKNIGIRGSVGGSYKKQDTFIEGFKDSDVSIKSSINYRVGIDYRTRWSSKFSGSIGLDWVGQFSNNNRVIDSGFDVIERVNLSNAHGGGLSTAIQWWFHKNVALGIETSFYYLVGKETIGRKFVNFPELDDDLRTAKTTEVQFPVALNILWKF